MDCSRRHAPDGKDGNPDEKCVEEIVEPRSPMRPFLGSAHREADRDERREVGKGHPENRFQQVQIFDNE